MHALTEMSGTVELGVLTPDDPEVFNAAAVTGELQPATADGAAARVIFPRLGKAEIDNIIIAEVRVQDYVGKAALTGDIHLGYTAGNRIGFPAGLIFLIN